jgi:hypothetical protein
MDKKLKEELKQPVNYRQQIKHNDHDNDGYVIETVQDCTDIVEENKEEMLIAKSGWGEDIFDNKIASIPMTVIDDLNKKQIMQGFQILDVKKFKEFLNHPDNRFFRTKPGRI